MTVHKLELPADTQARRADGFLELEEDICELEIWTNVLYETAMDMQGRQTKERARQTKAVTLLTASRARRLARSLHRKYYKID